MIKFFYKFTYKLLSIFFLSALLLAQIYVITFNTKRTYIYREISQS